MAKIAIDENKRKRRMVSRFLKTISLAVLIAAVFFYGSRFLSKQQHRNDDEKQIMPGEDP